MVLTLGDPLTIQQYSTRKRLMQTISKNCLEITREVSSCQL